MGGYLRITRGSLFSWISFAITGVMRSPRVVSKAL